MAQAIDGKASVGDRMISLEEFESAIPAMKKWGLRDEAEVRAARSEANSCLSGHIREVPY